MFRKLKVGIIADELTRSCLALECRAYSVTPANHRLLLKFWKPDLLFVESAWQGRANSWKYRIAAYPDHARRSNLALRKVVQYARERGIPAVFWNKEDGVHFERFIDSARLFDHVFTVDENCIARYRAVMGSEASVRPLMFAVQPAIHSPLAGGPVNRRACFVGSYSRHLHDQRRAWQDMMFGACQSIGLVVFDRNSSRRSRNYRYPKLPWLEVRRAVSYQATAKIYRDYLVSLNVNTVADSGTMFSRRLIEIIACGGLAATTPALSVDRYFRDFCEVVRSEGECRALFERLHRDGLSRADRERARAGADYVLREHTWAHRLAEVAAAVGL